jgi:hypothetical protein
MPCSHCKLYAPGILFTIRYYKFNDGMTMLTVGMRMTKHTRHFDDDTQGRRQLASSVEVVGCTLQLSRANLCLCSVSIN